MVIVGLPYTLPELMSTTAGGTPYGASRHAGAAGEHLRKFNTRKFLLREAMRGILPEKIRNRRTKSYFVSHQIDAIGALLRERPVRDLHCVRLGWVDPARIEAMHAPFDAWRRAGSTGEIPASAWGPVWFTLATDMWLEHAFKL